MAQIKSFWEADFGQTFGEDKWDSVWSSSTSFLFTNKAMEMQFEMIYRLQITPMKRNKFYPMLSKYCNKCKISEGTYFHCIFGCPLVKNFWSKCAKKLLSFLRRNWLWNQCYAFLGYNQQHWTLAPLHLNCLGCYFLVQGAGVLLQWISDIVPTISFWIQSTMKLIPLESISFWLKDQPFKFFHIWDPFLGYMGVDGLSPSRTDCMD